MSKFSEERTFLYTWAGRMDWHQARSLQAKLAEVRAAGRLPDLLLALEHPPVYTAGTRTSPEFLPGPEVLTRQGASLIWADRGGSITFHAPGQLVGYCIVRISRFGADLHRYLRILEDSLQCALADWGITGERDKAYTGVWVGAAKIASIGIKVSKGVTLHGFALNLRNNLSGLRDIVPCGIKGRGVTSLLELGVRVPGGREAAAVVARHLSRMLSLRECRYVPPAVLKQLAGMADG